MRMIKHSFSDWLDIHDLHTSKLTHPTTFMEQIQRLSAMKPPRHEPWALSSGRVGSPCSELSLAEAWDLAAAALTSFFPDKADLISVVKHRTRIAQHREAGTIRPSTMDSGPDHPVLIRLRFQGRSGDLLALAHEMGHALQIAACRHAFVPPAIREVCAFLSELALLEFLYETRSAHYALVLQAWASEHRVYLENDGSRLQHVVSSGAGSYDYRWNYPLARLAACSAFCRLPRTALWAVFRNQLKLSQLIGIVPMRDDSTLCDVRWRTSGQRASLAALRRSGLGVHAAINDQGSASRTTLRETFERLAREEKTAEMPCQSPHAAWMSGLSLEADYFADLGCLLKLLAGSSYHHRFPVAHYFKVEILPPLQRGQLQLYVSPDAEPSSLVTWAWLSPEAERDIHKTGRALRCQEWLKGTRLFFNDWIATSGSFRAVMRDMTANVFPDQIATSIQRNSDASVRRIKRWTGRNIRKPANRDSCAADIGGPRDMSCA